MTQAADTPIQNVIWEPVFSVKPPVQVAGSTTSRKLEVTLKAALINQTAMVDEDGKRFDAKVLHVQDSLGNKSDQRFIHGTDTVSGHFH